MKQMTSKLFAGIMAIGMVLPCAALQSGVVLQPGEEPDTQTDTPTYVAAPEDGKKDGTFVVSYIHRPVVKDKNLSILLKRHIFTENKPFAVDAQIVNRGNSEISVQLDAGVLVRAMPAELTVDKKKYTVTAGDTLDLRLANFPGLPAGDFTIGLYVWRGAADEPERVPLKLVVEPSEQDENAGVALLPLINNEHLVAPITTPAATLTPAKATKETTKTLTSMTPAEFMRAHRDPDFFLMNGLVYARVAYKEGMEEPLVQKGVNLGKIKQAKVRKNFEDWDSTKLASGTRIYACKGKGSGWAVSIDGKVYRVAEKK